MVKRVNFFDIFMRNHDGSLSPKYILKVGGIQFGPGVSFGPGVTFAGINFFDFQQYDIAIEEFPGYVTVKGFYKNG